MTCSNYDVIAGEYYDDRHTTSRNFDAATVSFFRDTAISFPPGGVVLELGAGRGRSIEYLDVDWNRIVQLDVSTRMLRRTPRERSRERIVGDALAIPISSNSVDTLTAFLYDPYNRKQLYSEIGRVLTDDGVMIGTLPHATWGHLLRDELDCPRGKTIFVTDTGREVELNSHLSTESELRRGLTEAGATTVETWELMLPPGVGPVSEHVRIPAEIAGVEPTELPIVMAVRATF